MLNRDKKKIFVICLILLTSFLIFIKVNSTSSIEKTIKNKNNEMFSKKEYFDIYNLANDTINNWIKNDIFISKAYKFSNWRLDSLICFNKSKNRCVMNIYRQNNVNVNNAIDYFYGAKFNNKWYFFQGAVIYLFSENYGLKVNTALSFKKLHEIAMKEVCSGYLKKKEKGFWVNLFSKPEYEINESFFKGMESRNSDGTYAPCFQTFKEAVLYQINHQWKKPDKDGYIKDLPCFDENNNIILPPYNIHK